MCYNISTVKQRGKHKMEKIDKRIHYIMVLDTETCNGYMENGKLCLDDSLVYDIGYAIVDKRGKVYETKSYINSDIFYHEQEMMKSAYYAKKIPAYIEDIKAGKRTVATYYEIRKDIIETLKKYNTNTVSAHNARFDLNACNVTERWLTKSKYRYFFPYSIEIWDTLKMARDVIGKMPTYRRYCEKNGYMTKHTIPQLRFTAEILYRFISGNDNFQEEHTGLEDVIIEKEILAYCFRQHKKMRKGLFEK